MTEKKIQYRRSVEQSISRAYAWAMKSHQVSVNKPSPYGGNAKTRSRTQRSGQVCTWHAQVAASQPPGNKLEASSPCRANPSLRCAKAISYPNRHQHAVLSGADHFYKRSLLLRLTSVCVVMLYLKHILNTKHSHILSFFSTGKAKNFIIRFFSGELKRNAIQSCVLPQETFPSFRQQHVCVWFKQVSSTRATGESGRGRQLGLACCAQRTDE